MKKTAMAKRLLITLLSVAVLFVFLISYSVGYAKVHAYCLQNGQDVPLYFFNVAMALIPALLARLFIAYQRRGLYKGQKRQTELDVSGLLALGLIGIFGVVGYFFSIHVVSTLIAPYYFTALWLAALCCFHRVPRPAVPEPAPQPAPVEAEPEPLPAPGPVPQLQGEPQHEPDPVCEPAPAPAPDVPAEEQTAAPEEAQPEKPEE